MLVCIAAIAGNQVGYLIGRKAGPALFNRPDSRLFKQEYVDKTHAFFDKHGPRAIVLARFVPIVRTFITVIAGVGKMNYRTYTIYSVIGGVLWGVGRHRCSATRWAASPSSRDHIELILIGIVAVSLLPVGFERVPAPQQGRRQSRHRADTRHRQRHRVGQEKSTVGAVRTASSSTSKYSSLWKPNVLATRFDGNDSTRVLSARTLAL